MTIVDASNPIDAMESRESFFERVNLLSVLDYSGRSGSVFVSTLFDQHPEVLCCPWIHYVYSYFHSLFDGRDVVLAKEFNQKWCANSYFRLLYGEFCDDDESTGAKKAVIYKIGGDASVAVDRGLFKTTLDKFCASREKISRREAVLISFYAFALSAGRDVSLAKYIFASDAISQRAENVAQGFSGQVIDHMMHDFPEVKIVSLMRDPRATFASNRHQFVNENGNMHGVKWNNVFQRFKEMISGKFTTENTVFLYWILYLMSSSKTARQKSQEYPQHFKVLKNEDLNLDFLNTMEDFCGWLSISMLDQWKAQPYEPTMMGAIWEGTGAYNTRYQPHRGSLENDSLENSRQARGPNKYVTERWKKRLAPHEVRQLEYLFRDELVELDYGFLHQSQHDTAGFVLDVFKPWKGEGGFGGLVLTALTWLPFYVISRIQLLVKVQNSFFKLK